MTWPKNHHVNLKELFIDRKMLVILAIFIVLGMTLVSTLILATNTLSSLRAFSTIQTYWTEARKDASFELIKFIETGDIQHFSDFNGALELIHDAHDLRLELMNESPDYDRARELMINIHVNPNDIESMITTYERLHSFAYLSDVVETWNQADRLIEGLVSLSEEVKSYYSESGPQNSLTEQQFINRVQVINHAFREHKDVVAAGLSNGTYLLRLFIIWVSATLGAILVISGSVLSYRFLKRIKHWASIVEISEQRYKSLFEHNPNAVFSLDSEGIIVSGNDAFERISGNSKKDLQYKNFYSLISSSERDNVEHHLKNVLKGNPKNFETEWVKKDGSNIAVHITMLPIYVDNQIEGVFTIAEDISYQKYAEAKIKNQLEEKTFLLSEIHDRVKNNLALISSLLQLQINYVNDRSVYHLLNSTVFRIHSMAMVHEHLYQTDNFATVQMDEFIKRLTGHIQSKMDSISAPVDIQIDADPVSLDIKQAVPAGLILNELISNSFKYAFNGSENGRLTISFKKSRDRITAIVQDNGKGFPEDFDGNSQSALGMTLVKTLVSQLNAEISFENRSGASVTFNFKRRKLSRI